MITRAAGIFVVAIDEQSPYEPFNGVSLGRLTISKRFSGDLEATSRVDMLSAISAVKGSAGYVAMERVSGTLLGKVGTFILQHAGTMDRGAPTLSVTVVPDSGTGELAGLSGHLQIDIADGVHHYLFEYDVADAV